MTADFLDQASDNEAAERDRLIAAARKPVVRKHTAGRCAYCNDVLDNPKAVYCSSDCRDDYELIEEARKRCNGSFYP